MELCGLSASPEENASEGTKHAEENRISHSSSAPCMIRGGRQQSKAVSANSQILRRYTSTIIWAGWNSASSFTSLHSNVRTETNVQRVSPYGSKLPSVLLKYFRKPSSASFELCCWFGFPFYCFHFLFFLFFFSSLACFIFLPHLLGKSVLLNNRVRLNSADLIAHGAQVAPFWTCPKILLWEKSDTKWTSPKQCAYEPVGGTWSQTRSQCLAVSFRNKSIVFQITFTELNSLVSGNLHLNSFSRYLFLPVKPPFISCLFCITAIRVVFLIMYIKSISLSFIFFF